MAANKVEDVPGAEDIQTQFISNLLLLQELHGILGLAVLRAGVDRQKAFICSELATLGLKLGVVSPTLYPLSQLGAGVIEAYQDHISQALVLLSEMVTEDLIRDHEQLASSEVAWPSLIILHDIIASRYKDSPEGKQHSDAPPVLTDEKLLTYLTFQMKENEQKLLLESLSCVSRDLDQLLTISRSRAPNKLQSTDNFSEEEDDVVILAKQAQDYRQQISDLYKILARNMGPCEKRHMAQLCLSNFGIDKNTLDIYISICTGPVHHTETQSVAWHPTRCSKKEHSTSDSIPGNLCQYLNNARARRLPAALTYSAEGLAEDSAELRRLPREDLLWSFVDLAAVLDETSGETQSSLRINAANKLRLQCLLTQSLLFLHPSSWMPETLSLDNVFFTTQNSICDFKNPYMYCAFEEGETDHDEPDIDAVTEFMIYFGFLLLQIEIGSPLPLSQDEQTDEYGHELALDRYMEEFGDSLNTHISQVLSECLWFRQCLRKIPHSKMPLDLKIRFAVSQYILKPLMGSLEFNYPNIAREILPYTMEQQQEFQKPAHKDTRSTQKRKTTEDAVHGLTRHNESIHMMPPPLANQNRRSPRQQGNPKIVNDPTEQRLQPEGKVTIYSPINTQELEQKGSEQLQKSSLSQPIFQVSRSSYNAMAPLKPEDFNVGWISALPLEKAVACEMLDEEYPKERRPWYDTQRDHNPYTFGRLHGHNIIIACLPKGRYGTNSAAIVAQHMLASFPIKIGLLVGIAGGAPSKKHDIRLGDVVVGSPTPRFPGVIQYDYGKAIGIHDFEETGYMTPPPEMLLSGMASLESQHKRKGHQIDNIVDGVLTANKRLYKEYIRPPASTDQLYNPSYKHCTGGLCMCRNPKSDPLKQSTTSPSDSASASTIMTSDSLADDPRNLALVARTPRDVDGDTTVIHYGLIASANTLMKDAEARDALIKKHDVLCFETEAAGIVNSFPCVVIRGICDYSDSHKNDLWQGYAAANAAAYAKEFLEIIPTDLQTGIPP